METKKMTYITLITKHKESFLIRFPNGIGNNEVKFYSSLIVDAEFICACKSTHTGSLL